jgi:hypothetical protein
LKRAQDATFNEHHHVLGQAFVVAVDEGGAPNGVDLNFGVPD